MFKLFLQKWHTLHKNHLLVYPVFSETLRWALSHWNCFMVRNSLGILINTNWKTEWKNFHFGIWTQNLWHKWPMLYWLIYISRWLAGIFHLENLFENSISLVMYWLCMLHRMYRRWQNFIWLSNVRPCRSIGIALAISQKL